MNNFGKKIRGAVSIGGIVLEIKTKEPTVNSLRPGEVCLYGGEIYVNDGGTIRSFSTGGGSGEANTASNVGAGGVGVFKQKSGVDLQFKNVNAGSARMSVVDDTVNDEVDIDVVEASLDHGNIGGLADDDHTQYIKADGTRAFSGNIRTGGNWLSSDGDNEGVFVDSSGYVGINTNAPATILDVNGNAYIGNQVAGNYAEFETDGTLKFNGDATVWGRISVDIVTGSTGNPDWQSFRAGKSILMDAASDDIISGRVVLPGDYKEGSSIYLSFHWHAGSANAGNIVFKMDYSWANVGDTYPLTSGLSLTKASGSAAEVHKHDFFSAISGTGKKIDSIMCFDFYRAGTDAGDTYADDIYVERVVIHYERDTVGSRGYNSK